MSKEAQILIGNLSTDAKEEQICEMFSKTAGKLKSLSIPKDPRTDKGRGFAFVVMNSIIEAQEAISILSGESINGRKLSMSLVEPKKEERKWYQRR
jgi:RNA recognition motif-containing protein